MNSIIKTTKTTAHITTDTNGNITTESTMTVDGQTVTFDITGQALMNIELIRSTFENMGTRYHIPANAKLVEVRNAKRWLQGYTFEVATTAPAGRDPFAVAGLDMDFLLSASA